MVPDEAVLAACGTGDAGALGLLFDRFHVQVRRYLERRTTCEPAVLDDVVQATFLALPQIAGSFRGQASVLSWILGVARNLVRHQVRKDTRRRLMEGAYAVLPPPEPTPTDVEVDRRRWLGRIASAVETLPREQQVVFILCDLERYPGVEVADALAIPEGTLYSRLHTARATVRNQVAHPHA